MNLKIASAINKIRITPKQAVNLNVNPNQGNFVKKSQKAVKIQIVKSKAVLRKTFKQQGDEFIAKEVSQDAHIPSRIKQLKKIKQHKRHRNIKLPQQDSLIVQISEEKNWKKFIKRYYKKSKSDNQINLSKHYRNEITSGNSQRKSNAKKMEEGYTKATEAKTKAYFDEIKTNNEYNEKLFWSELILPKIKRPVLYDINNKLLPF